jgi:hypothetical protein
MICREIEDQLPLYLEDLLAPKEKGLLEEHLSVCPFCRQRLADSKKTEEILKDLEEVEAPPFFEERIMARVREEAGEKKSFLQKLFFPIRIKVPIQALTTVLIAVLAVYLYQQNEPEIKPNLIPPPPYQEPAKGSGPTDFSPAPQPPKVVLPARPAPEKDLIKKEPEAFAPAPPAADIREGTRKEKATGPLEEEKPAIEKPGGPIRAMKDKEDVSPRLSAFTRGSERGEKQEAGSGFETSSLERKGERVLAQKKALAREEKAGRSSSPVLSKGEGTRNDRPGTVEVIVLARQMEQAVREIEERLIRIGARVIEQKHLAGKAFLKTEIAVPQIGILLDTLEGMGKVIFNQKTLEGQEGQVILTIQILTYPNPDQPEPK